MKTKGIAKVAIRSLWCGADGGERFVGLATLVPHCYMLYSMSVGNTKSVGHFQRTVICYNCKGEGHIAKQCTKPKRKRDETWFNDKVLLVQAQAGGQALTEEEIAFLADPGLPDVQNSQTVITHNAAYQADDLDAYDSNNVYSSLNRKRDIV
ncbi:putative ribonuclease H-like domain-containing protein [Tanacetum coccineum]